MSPVTRALVWGQFRRHWPLVVLTSVVGCVVDPYFRFFDASMAIPVFGFLDENVCVVILLGLALLSVTPDGQPPHLIRFPRDLFRLPVSSVRLVTTVLACRTIAAVVFVALVLFASAYRAGNVTGTTLLSMLSLFVAGFVCLQTSLWIAGGLVPSAAVVVYACLKWAGVLPHIPLSTLEMGLVLLAPFTFVFSLVAASLARRGARMPWSGTRLSVDIPVRRPRRFMNPRHALFSFIWRDSGRRVFAVFAMFCILITVASSGFGVQWAEYESQANPIVRGNPGAAFLSFILVTLYFQATVIGFLLVGGYRIVPVSELKFLGSRPIGSVELGRLRAQFAFSMAAGLLLLVFCLAIAQLAVAYFRGYINRETWPALFDDVVFSRTFVTNGLLDPAMFFVAASRPGLTAAISAVPGLVYWSVTSGLYAPLPVFLPDGATVLDWSLALAACVAVAGVVFEYVVAIRRGLVSHRGATIALGIWLTEIVIATALWLAGILPAELTVGRFAPLLGFLSLTVVSRASLVNEIDRRRHNQDGRSHFFW